MSNNGTLRTPFLEGRRYRTDELGEATMHGLWWRRFALLESVLIFLLIGGCVYLGSLPRWKPYYVEVDTASGNTRVSGPAPERYQPKEALVKASVRTFIETLRGISTDKEQMKRQWKQAYACVTKRGRAMLHQTYEVIKPMAQRDPVLVTILRTLPKTGTTLDVRWQEVRYNDHGEALSGGTIYSGLFTLELREPRILDELELCPAGVFLDTWSFSKEGA